MMPTEGRCLDGGRHAELRGRLAEFLTARSVIVGVGNRLRGDDGFGPAVVDALRGQTPLALLDAGVAPENFVEQITGRRPDGVLFVDAAECGRPAGDLVLVGPDELAGGDFNTHGDLTLPAEYIRMSGGIAVLFLLAQPSDAGDRRAANGPGQNRLSVTERLSPPMRQAVERAGRLIRAALDCPARVQA